MAVHQISSMSGGYDPRAVSAVVSALAMSLVPVNDSGKIDYSSIVKVVSSNRSSFFDDYA